eukprot:Gb_40879 [translate_table: standard]
MGRKLDALMGKTFRSSKCKTLLKLTISRMKILKNKREMQCKQSRKDVAQLLQNGQEASARLRVEHVLREQNIVDAYILIEGYCGAVIERMISIEKQKTCPVDLKESIASLVFAAPRCADLPELQDVRSLFTAKYGKEFITAAIELRPDCGVNRQIIEKLSARLPSAEVKLRLMKEIAAEHGVEWNFEEAQSEVRKPAEDLLDGPKQFFGESQTIFTPAEVVGQDSVPQNGRGNIEPGKRPPVMSQGLAAAAQPIYPAYSPHSSPPNSSPGVSLKTEQQGLEKLANSEVQDSPPLHAAFHIKEEQVASSKPARGLDSSLSGKDPYIGLQTEGNIDCHTSTKTTAGYENISSINDYPDLAKFSNAYAGSVGLKEENVKYTDVASAAQAAFESAAYAAAAARAAVDLARSEAGNKKLNQRADQSREESSESEDELDGTHWGKRNEGIYTKPIHRFESDIEESISGRNDEAFDTKGSRTTRHGPRDVSSPGTGFERVHPSQKVNSESSESGEEPLEDQLSWSKDGRSHLYKSDGQHFYDHSDDEQEDESNAHSWSQKLQNKHEYTESTGPQLKSYASNSNDHSSSFKATQPVFDDYEDDEDEHEKPPSGRSRYQSVLKGDRFENEDSEIGPFQHTAHQKQFDDDDDRYEMGMRRKEDQKEDYIQEKESKPYRSGSQIMRPRANRTSEDGEDQIAQSSQRSSSRQSKPAFRDFVRQERHSLQYFEPQFDDEAEPLNDIEGMKFHYHSKLPMPSSQLDDDQEPTHNRPSRQDMRGMVSDVRSNTDKVDNKYESHLGKISDSEGVYRYEGDGKLRWHPANLEEQPVLVESKKSAYRRDNGMSVRTRRVAREQHAEDKDKALNYDASKPTRDLPLPLRDDDLSVRFEAPRRNR